MRHRVVGFSLLLGGALAGPAAAQVVMAGRLMAEKVAGSADRVPLTGVMCFAALPGADCEPRPFRTWETEPVGWYRFSGTAGAYTLLFTSPAHYVRPYVLTNIHTRAGDKLDRVVMPGFEYACFQEAAWDDKRASHYYQTFVARGTGITHVGFKLAHDGVDGGGPGAQNLLLSIHRPGPGTPDTWEQIGPAVLVPQVDCGGPKSYSYSAGWNSGEVPTTPGQTYAVHLRAENPEGTFQAWWRPDEDRAADCYRLGGAGTSGWTGRDLWMAIDGDGDGLLIPYNKRVHRQFVEFAGGGKRWAQTYVAQGRGLAAAILYAAVGTAEPPLSRQRCRVRIRRGGPEGPVVGLQKLAIGNGNYTGDASWGVFAAVYAPGEVALEPGQTYAIEFETIESYETLHGFINMKNQPSTEVPGFNPYRKVPPDHYEQGTAWADGRRKVDFDLDMQIVEYQFPATTGSRAVEGDNLLANGDFQATGAAAGASTGAMPDAWQRFGADTSSCQCVPDGKSTANRIARVSGEGLVDGGLVQRVEKLDRLETYLLEGQVRCSWAADVDRALLVGFDPTGQITDPQAATIVWTTLPSAHGVWLSYQSEPIRPAGDSISVWLRGRTTARTDYPFKADFDAFSLRRVRIGIPGEG